jgi:hypothetical protein
MAVWQEKISGHAIEKNGRRFIPEPYCSRIWLLLSIYFSGNFGIYEIITLIGATYRAVNLAIKSRKNQLGWSADCLNVLAQYINSA